MRIGKARLALAIVAAICVLAVASVVWLNRDDDADVAAAAPSADAIALVARGEYLVRAGSCFGCHTEPGGAPYAGGRAIETPFGIVHATNLTPDATGLAAWSSDDFWRALHNGRSRDGRLLYPAFPYPNYTRVTRGDSDAMFAYLKSLAPVAKPNRPHALRFPFDQQASLALWRALFFRPARFEADTARSPQWNRGAYLVETLGHCNACHSRRNVFGATAGPLDLAGGLIPIQNWYAPSLYDNREAGVGDWSEREVVALLKSGVSTRGSVQGPMAEVVARSTRYLSDADLAAMAAYLSALPVRAAGRSARGGARRRRSRARAGASSTPTTARPATASRAKASPARTRRWRATGRSRSRRRPTSCTSSCAAASRRRPTAIRARSACRRSRPCSRTRTSPTCCRTCARSWGHRAAAVSTLEVSRYRGAARALRRDRSRQNGMSSSMSLKPDDFAAGRFAAAAAGRAAGAGRS